MENNFLLMYLIFKGRQIELPAAGREVKASRKYKEKIFDSINGTLHHDIKGYNTSFNVSYKYVHADFVEDILDFIENYIETSNEPLYFCAKRRDGTLYSSEAIFSEPKVEVVKKKNDVDWYYSISFKISAKYSSTNENGKNYELAKFDKSNSSSQEG